VREERERPTGGKQDKHEATPPTEVSSGGITPLDKTREILPSYPSTHAASRRAKQRPDLRESSPHTRSCQAWASTQNFGGRVSVGEALSEHGGEEGLHGERIGHGRAPPSWRA